MYREEKNFEQKIFGDYSVSQSNLKSMFSNYVDQESLFKNKEALTTNYTPDNILHREQQINDLGSILAPALKGNDPSNVFLYGSVGTGKTLIVQHVTEELKTVARDKEIDLNVLYINCKMKKVADTEYRLLAKLARQLGEDVPSTGLPTDEIYNRFFKALKQQKGVVIIALDEIDALVKKVGDEFLYNLTRINDDLEETKVSILGISNDLNFTEYMDSRVKSSLSEEEIIFPPYNAIELREILKERTEKAFIDEALKDGVISKCSALAAQEHGDARRALDLLRVAGELAERSEDKIIEKSHVDNAQDKIERDRVVETVRSQPKHSKLVLYTILDMTEEEDKIATGDVYSEYKELCTEVEVSELTQRRVSGLISELDMLGVINAKVISKGRYGRTRQISVDLSENIRQQLNDMVENKFYLNED
jgi:cell division control protein 6